MQAEVLNGKEGKMRNSHKKEEVYDLCKQKF